MEGEGDPDGGGGGPGGSREGEKGREPEHCSQPAAGPSAWVQPAGGGAASWKCLPLWEKDGKTEEEEIGQRGIAFCRRKAGKTNGKEGEEKSEKRLEEDGEGRRIESERGKEEAARAIAGR